MPRRIKRSDERAGDEVAAAAKRRGKPAAQAADAAGWLVYILRCADGTLYTGCTIDMDRRLRCHSRRQVKYTRSRLPVELLYREPVPGRSAALKREIAIKRLARSQKLALVDGRKL